MPHLLRSRTHTRRLCKLVWSLIASSTRLNIYGLPWNGNAHSHLSKVNLSDDTGACVDCATNRRIKSGYADCILWWQPVRKCQSKALYILNNIFYSWTSCPVFAAKQLRDKAKSRNLSPSVSWRSSLSKTASPTSISVLQLVGVIFPSRTTPHSFVVLGIFYI